MCVCSDCFCFSAHLSFNYMLLFFYSFIKHGSGVLSNITAAEPEKMWYFKFGGFDRKKFRFLLSAVADSQRLYDYMF